MNQVEIESDSLQEWAKSMSNIDRDARILLAIVDTECAIARTEKWLEENPNSFSAKMSLDSLRRRKLQLKAEQQAVETTALH